MAISTTPDLDQLRRRERRAWLEYCEAAEILRRTPEHDAQGLAGAKLVRQRTKERWESASRAHGKALAEAEGE
jgi:hypothetical protein